MKCFVYYRPNGVIQQVTQTSDDAASPTVVPGLLTIESPTSITGREHHVENGALVAGLLDLRTLPERKQEKWEFVKLARTSVIDAPLATPFGAFDSDAAGRGNISDALLLAQAMAGRGQTVAIDYTRADNTVVTLDLTKIVTVWLTLGAKVQTTRGIATGLRTQIDAATTIAQLEAVTWPVI